MGKARTPPGIHARRLLPEQNCPREVAFAEQWAKENEWSDLLDLLSFTAAEKEEEGAVRIHDPGLMFAYAKFPLGKITERDRVIAATVIQWLGSNVGMGFLHAALERAGYRLEKVRD